MGKTYRHLPDTIFRKPKGHKQAKANKVRHKAIPPNAWDDIMHNNECWQPFKVAQKMKSQGFEWEEISNRVKFKFNLTAYEVHHLRGMLYR